MSKLETWIAKLAAGFDFSFNQKSGFESGMEAGFLHAIEVLEQEATDDVPMSRDAIMWAVKILKAYAEGEE